MLEVEIEGDGPKVRKAIDAIATLVTLGRVRESGDSIPAAAAAEHPFPPGVSYGGPPEPPVLNKSGGSEVCTCGHEAGRHGDNTCGGPQGNCACDHYQPAAGPAPRLRKGK